MKTKNKILSLFTLFLLVICIIALFLHKKEVNMQANAQIPEVMVIKRETPITKENDFELFEDNYSELNMYIEMQNELIQEEIKKLDDSNKKEWFVGYKDIIEKNIDILDPPETIYDYLVEEELNLLFSVVEAECTSGGFDEKVNVASVIFNRLGCEKWGCSIKDILVESQFHVIKDGRYKKVEVTEDTILACEFVFSIGDTTGGAIYFEGGDSNIHISYAEYLFTDNIGHKFYR